VAVNDPARDVARSVARLGLAALIFAAGCGKDETRSGSCGSSSSVERAGVGTASGDTGDIDEAATGDTGEVVETGLYVYPC